MRSVGVAVATVLGIVWAPAVGRAQKASFEDLMADAQVVPDLAEIARPFLEKCDERDDELRRQCEGVRVFLQRHLRELRLAADVEGAVELPGYQPKSQSMPVTVRGCLTCKSTGLEVDGAKVWIGVGPKAELAKKSVPLLPEKVKKWQANVGPHLRTQFIFGLTDKAVPAAPAGRPLGVEVLGWRVYNRCTGEVLLSEPASQRTGPVEEEGCPQPEPEKAAEEPAAPPDHRPQKLGRYEIEQALATLKPKIKACYDRYEIGGRADAILDIQGDGLLRAAHIKGSFEGTPTARCLLEAMDGLRFPAFRSGQQRVEYPFYLR